MKSTSARGAALAILLASLNNIAWCQTTGQPCLLPMPPVAAANTRQAVCRATVTDAFGGGFENTNCAAVSGQFHTSMVSATTGPTAAF
jgi:hypothetical protein